MAAAVEDSWALTSSGKSLELSTIRALLGPTLRDASAETTDESAHLKEAAVALVLRHTQDASTTPGTELLLIRRSEKADDPWSGHMALPGGRRDLADVSLVHTAQRETREEVGLQLDQVGTLIGCLPRVPAMAQGRPVGMTIKPFVFQLNGIALLQVNHEVAEVLWVPLERLRNGTVDTFIDVPLRGAGSPLTKLPAWSIGGRIIWGLTYHMIMTMLELLARPPLAERGHEPK